MENREALERLAANPHYKMSLRQIEALRRLRQTDKNIQHSTGFAMHDTDFQRHEPEPPRQEDTDAVS